MQQWISSDYHLGEDRMEIMGRPFASGMECVEAMIANHNSVVAPDDEVIVVGDVCYQKHPEFLPHIARFNGKKTLIRGNHDRVFSDSELAPYFQVIIPDGDGMSIQIGQLRCWVTHYPTRGHSNEFNLVGHIHSAWKLQKNMLNVGVDVNHYYPMNLAKVPFYLKAICEFYDEDVWVGYNDINASWKDKRGKPGSYFVPGSHVAPSCPAVKGQGWSGGHKCKLPIGHDGPHVCNNEACEFQWANDSQVKK